MRTLTMTSPLMHGPDVREAQQKLIAARFLRAGHDDGQFGPETGRSAMQAHWMLGFSSQLAHAPTYGDSLDRVLDIFLSGKVLPPRYAANRKKRLATLTLGEEALAWLRPHVGDTEHPEGSNRVEWASVWYGIIGPWCAMGATRAYVEAGSKAFARGKHYAYVPYIVSDAIAGRNWLARTFMPLPGDLVAFDWPHLSPGTFDHVELVDHPPASMAAGTAFTTIGCNTSFDDHGDQSNGGACAHKEREVLSGGRVVFVHVRA